MPNDAIGRSGAAELDREIHSTGNSFSSQAHDRPTADKPRSRAPPLANNKGRSAHKIDKIFAASVSCCQSRMRH